jgi:[acyl-carrier-protein] S-malonyltransferase
MRLALLFSGQGGQRPEHWDALCAEAPVSIRSALAGVGLTPLTVNPENLAKNHIAQPLIFAQQMTRWAQLQARLPRPIVAAGYSLGEMAACAAAGAFTAEQGIALCAARARAMDAAAPGESGMLAVLGLADAQVGEIATDCGLAVAIRNAPRHLVVAGPQTGIVQAATRFEALGASRVVPLAVHTPSHTPALAAASADFAAELADLPDSRLNFPVLSAIDASVSRRIQPALDALARQISTPLDWAACLQVVLEMQPDAVLEIGPGNAMARLFAELAPDTPVRACDDFRSNEGLLDWLGRCA